MHRIDINQIAKENIAYFINDDIALIEDFQALQNLSMLDKDFLIDGYVLVMVLNGDIKIELEENSRQIGPGNILICPPNNLLKNIMVSIDFKFKAMFCSLENGDAIAMEKGSNKPFYAVFQKRFGIIPVCQETMTMCVNTFELFKLCLTNSSLPNKRRITDGLYLTLVRIIEETLVCNKQVTELKPFKSAEAIVAKFFHILEHRKVKRCSVEQYAGMLNISTKYFSNVCRKVTGKSANATINEFVIKDAVLLLHDNNRTIKEIALELGFINQSHFGSFFRRIKGISPNKFRASL